MKGAGTRGKTVGRRKGRAFLVMDCVAGIVLALAMLMMMTVAVIKQDRREKEFTEIRAASRAAETALLSLDAGEPLPPGAMIERLRADAPPGFTWARLTLSTNGHVSTLVGLVDIRRLAKSGATP